MQNALQASETESISKQVYTRIHPVQTPNLYLTTFLNKKVNNYFFMIFNYQVLIESRNRKPCFSESAVADFVLHFTLILDSCIFQSKREKKLLIK